MELKRILARDTRTATEKAIAMFGPDVLIISNNRVEGQTELIVAMDVAEASSEDLLLDENETDLNAKESVTVSVAAINAARRISSTPSSLNLSLIHI